MCGRGGEGYGGIFIKSKENIFDASWMHLIGPNSNVHETVAMMGRCSTI
jgi:hypothetical protein